MLLLDGQVDLYSEIICISENPRIALLIFMRLALVCFYCLCVFVYVLYFIATMSFAGYFLPVLFCMLSMLISDSRFDLVWFRLSCDHGWIRSGSVNVSKQQQQQQQHLPAGVGLGERIIAFDCTPALSTVA